MNQYQPLIDSTIDPYEVEYYSKLADTWWDTQGPFWPLHTLNKLRVEYIVRHLITHFSLNCNAPYPLNGLKILDIGCGGGILSEAMAKLGAHVTGIDIVEKNINIAKLHAEQQNLNIKYNNTSVLELQKNRPRYDVVLNMEVVEHVNDLQTFMQACNQLIDHNGVTFISTINRNIIAWLVAIIGAEYILKWLPKGTHRYTMLRKPNEIIKLLENDHINIKEIVGVKVSPFSRSMHLSSIKWINYMMFCTKNT